MVSGAVSAANSFPVPYYAAVAQRSGSAEPRATKAAGDPSSRDEQSRIDQLAAIDRKVRTHEQAHLAAGADLVRGGVSFEYVTGPDGKRYAVGGEVGIDVSRGKTPEETLQKAARIRAAALAPADPSGQDQQVAAAAGKMAMEARQEIAAQGLDTQQGTTRNGRLALAAYQQVSGLALSSGFHVQA